MSHPAFFDAVARIALRDPLAELLGAADDGLIEYGYSDAVKLAGHSCPTVAGAYLMTLKALKRLYPDTVPERGSIRIAFGSPVSEGTTGVIAAVAGLLTGAAGAGGFQGLNGRFSRRDLLTFEAGNRGDIRFRLLEGSKCIRVHYHPEVVPAPAELPALMQKLQSGSADKAERAEFGRLWQMRVKRILIEHIDDPALVVCEEEASQTSA